MKSVRFYKDNAIVERFVALNIPGCDRGFGPSVQMGVYLDGKLIAGVVFHNYCPEAKVVEMSAASIDSRWLSRGVLKEMHEYIFDTADCQMAVLRVSENNKRMLRIAGAYGYRKHLIPRLRGRNEAEAILTLSDDDWRQSKFHR